MSLYGINAYTSSSYLTTLMSGKNSAGLTTSNSAISNLLNTGSKKTSTSSSSSKDSTYDFLKNISKTDSNTDLQTLMQKINLVRSKGYQKSMTEEYRKIFAGESTSSSSTSNTELDLSKTAKSLSSSASELVSGNMEYYNDSEKLLSGVKDFISSYNSTIDGLKESESTLALQKGVSMVSSTAAYSKTLSNVGISIGKDNKLSIDESKFNAASVGTVKSLFSGNYSYASKTAEKASYIDRAAQIQSATTYNSLGKTTSALEYAMMNSMYSKLF